MKTIRAVEESLTKRKDKPKVVVCFQTDGEENASWAHNWEDLHGLVTAKTAEGWEFNFMGAGLDAYVQARKMGVTGQSTMSYQTDRGGTMAAFAASAGNTRLFSSGARANTQYTNSQKVASGDRYAGRHGVDDTVPGMSPPKKPPVGRSNRKP